jgi:ComF family protein
MAVATPVSYLLDLVFPPRCAGCGARGAVLCSACLAKLRPPDAQLCAGCERPLAPALAFDATGAPQGLCERCQAEGLSVLAGLLMAVRYEGMARQAILELKYQGQHRLAEPLGGLLAHNASKLAPHVDLVLPVPLHSRRRRERGYNQAELLARICGRRLDLPVRADLLERVRATHPQVGLSAAERRTNVAGAFATTAHASAVLSGRSVLLVDDVSTTGATLASAAAPLTAAGASSVWGLTVARPTIDSDGRRAPTR